MHKITKIPKISKVPYALKRTFVCFLYLLIFVPLHATSTHEGIPPLVKYATPPTVISFYPADNDVEVDTASIDTLVITFDRLMTEENVRGGDKKIGIRKNGENGPIQELNANSKLITIQGNKAFIVLTEPLPAGSSISVHIPAGIFVDEQDVNNVYTGIADNDFDTWNFTTASIDNTAPELSSFVPANGANNVSPETSLTLNFNEPVTTGQGNITIHDGNTILQTIDTEDDAVTISEDKKTVTIQPPLHLPGGTNIHVLIQSGAFKDLNNNNFTGISNNSEWSFTTILIDDQDPVITAFAPPKGTTDVEPDTPLEITFSEAIQKGVGRIIFNYGTTQNAQVLDVSDPKVTVTSNKVSIRPEELPPATQISIAIETGAFKDEAGNTYKGISNDVWSFTTAPPEDQMPPVVTAYSPTNNTKGVGENTSLQITFDEDIKATDKKIQLFQGNTMLEEIPANEASRITIEDKQVIINPTNTFPSQAKIYILIEAGAFTDQAGNLFAGIAQETIWSFTVKDYNAPTVAGFSPANKAVNVTIDKDLILTFDEAVAKGSGNITITAGTVVQNINVSDAAVVVNGNTVTINPADLPYSSSVIVQISDGAFQDIAGNSFAGITNNTTWNFTTIAQPDNTPPIVTAYLPANNAIDIDVTSNLLLTFDEPVEKGTTRSITIYQDNTLLQTIDITTAAITVSDNVLTINPPQNLPEGVVVNVRISAEALADTAGNSFAGITDKTSWQFTTKAAEDTQPPVISTLTPANKAVEVEPSVNLVITFNEDVQAGVGNITIIQGNTSQQIPVNSAQLSIIGNTVAIDLLEDFASAASVSILIDRGTFTDKAGNAFEGIASPEIWAFSIKDITPLQATSFSPINIDTAAIDTNLDIEFNKPVIRGAGTITLYAGTTIQPIDVTDTEVVTISDNIVTINPVIDLPYNTLIYIHIAEGAFKDAAGNNFAGIADQTTWTFTTAKPEDTTPPVITSLSPEKQAQSVAVTSDLILRFSEPIAKGSGNIIIKYNNQDKVIDILSNQVVLANEVVTINPPDDLPFATLIAVLIPETGFKDLAGNNFTSMTDPTAWTFTTAEAPDNTPPTVQSLNPAKNAENVPTGSQLELVFDEPVEKGTGNINISQGNTIQQINVESEDVVIDVSKVIITPSQPLVSKARVQIEIKKGTFKDKSGNPFEGFGEETAWTFGVEDETGPLVTAIYPSDDENDVPLDADLEITFDEEVEKGQGQITINTNGKSKTVAVNSNAVNVVENKATIDPNQNFPAGADVSVQIDPGAFINKGQKPFQGLTDPTAWNFRTLGEADVQAPTITTYAPIPGSTDVNPEDNLVLTFSEAIIAGQGNIIIMQGATLLTIPITDAQVTITDSILTINPSADFTEGAAVSIQLESGIVTDLSENAFAGITDSTTWRFTIKENTPVDITPPTVITYLPANKATAVAINSNLLLTFDEPVEKGATGSITIYQDNTLLQTINIASTTAAITDNVLTIDPLEDLPEGVLVNVRITAGALADTAGNAFAGITNNATWQFTTKAAEDTQPPVISTFSPANNATEIAVDANLLLTFNEPVQATDKKISIYQNNVLLEELAANSNLVTITDNQVTINPINDFAEGATIHILTESGAFSDVANNAFAGITDNTTWNFTTLTSTPVDNSPPTVTTYLPVTNAIEVALNTNLTLTFSEPVEKGATGSITIYEDNTLLQTINITTAAIAISDNVLTIDPPQDLPGGVLVNVRISTEAITDTAGNSFAGITDNTSWQFTTATNQPVDQTPPVIATLSPTDEATEVAIDTDLVLTFDEALAKGSGSITITAGAVVQSINVSDAAVSVNGNTVTINPADLPYSSSVIVQISDGALQDVAGNSFAGIADNSTWNFTTVALEDTTPPIVTAYLPANNAIDIDITSNLLLTFDEPVEKGATGSITIYQDNTLLQSIEITNAAITVSDNVLTIDPPQDLPEGVLVNVRVSAGAVADTAGNAFVGITNNTTWTFSTQAPQDIQPPVVTSLSPLNNATNVGVNENLVILFDELVKKGAGNIILSINEIKQNIDVTQEIIFIEGNKVTINPTEDFPGGAIVSITIEPGTFADLAGNPYAGNSTDWTFSVINNADNIAPVATAFAPPDNATDVAVDAVLTITFSEEVKKGTGNILINQGISTESIEVNSDLVSVNGNTVTITPPENFPSGSNISILMLSGVFTDLAGNSYAGINNANTWNFTVPDNIQPQLAAVFPPDNTTDVAPNINLVMIFDENIQKGSGTIFIRQNTAIIQQIDISSPDVIVKGTTVIINPPNDFPVGTIIDIQMPEGSFTDIAGNPFAGITDAESWNLTITGTSDNNEPIITELTPADGSVDVAPNTILTITFDENIAKGTGTITINQGASSQTVDVNSEAVIIEGNTVKITPAVALPEGAAISVLIPAGVFVDLANNAFPGVLTAEEWNFQITEPTPSDATPPAVVTYSPADNATNVAANTNLVVTFNEPVKKGQGNIIINLGSNSRQINIESNAVTINGAEVTIDPATDLPAGSQVSVLIENGALEDIAGNAFAGIENQETWNFTIASSDIDIIPSAILFLSPQDDATNVGANTNLVITFNEPVKKGQGNIILNQGETSQEININSAAVTILANTVTINPPVDFPDGADISVQIPGGAITDLANNNFAGITTPTDWNFTIEPSEDNTPPAIVTFSPANNATEIAVDANLILTFDEAIEATDKEITIYQNNVLLEQLAANSNLVTITDNQVTINPAQDFVEGASIYVSIEAGAFTDMANNAFAGIADNTTWNFTTLAQPDNTPPIVTAYLPANNAIDIDVTSNLSITFDEPIKKGTTGSISIYQGNTLLQSIEISNAAISVSDQVLTINPPQNLPASVVINVQISTEAITDTAGNAFAGITNNTTWTFTTSTEQPVDQTPPVIISLAPANNDTEIAVDTDLILTFDERVLATDKKISIYQNNVLLEELAANSTFVTINDNEVSINPSNSFAEGATIHILIEAGAFSDIANNAFAGITDNTTWRFTIKENTPVDITPPTVTTYLPANKATAVAINSNLLLTFDEPVEKGVTGNVTIYQDNTLLQTIDITTTAVSINDRVLTINPPQNLPEGVLVNVRISAGAIADTAGNAFAGITDNTTWQFTTATEQSEDQTPPVIVTLSPENNASEVVVNANLLLTFDEAIQATDKKISIYQNNVLLEDLQANATQVTITDKQVRINPSNTFIEGATIYVLIEQGAFTNLANNSFAGITDNTTWTFTIQEEVSTDTTAPKATAYTPADKSEDVAADTNLEITFDEAVKAGTGIITLRLGNTTQQIAINSNAVSIAGNKITINPPANFVLGATVNVEIPEGAITDLAGNAFEGTDATTWSFSIISNTDPSDRVAPEIVRLLPANNATSIAPGANLVITFNEPIKKGVAGSITIYQGSTLLQTVDITNTAITITDKVLTINPPQNLPSGVSVNVRVTAGAVADSAGNAFEGITDNSTWTFTTSPVEDNTPPLVSSVSPAHNAVNVATGENLVITFNERIERKTGNIRISVNNVAQNIPVTDQAQVSIADNILTVNPTAEFPFGAVVSVEVPAGVVSDEAGNLFRGIASGSWRFTIATEVDKTAPTATLFSPADDAVIVPVNANLSITFTEPVKKGTGSITLSQNGFIREIPITDPAISINGNAVSIDIEGGFLPGSSVYVLLPAGIFTDMAGNAYAGVPDATGWNFTVANTSDFSKPVVNSLSPPDNSTGVAADVKLVMVFNKPVIMGQGNIIITHGTSSQTIDVNSDAISIEDQTVTIDAPADFPTESYVSVLILPGTFKDLANNAFEGILDANTWNFTIEDNKAPALVSLFPADDASDIPANINLVLAFDEKIVKGSGQITLTSGNTSQTIDINSEAVIVSGSTVIINPPADFPFGSQVSIQIPAGTFTDASGNPYAGLTEGSAWNLTVSAFSDTNAPLAVSFNPADNSTGVQANSNLEIVFSENVTKGSGTITINQGTTSQTIDINSADVLISGSTVTINPPADFPFGAQVHVLIQEGAIKDLANNIYTGITDASTWNFTVDASIPVTIVSQNFPEVIVSSAANVEASIELSRLPEATKVELVFRGIAGADWNRQQLTSSTVHFPATLSQSQFDEIGLEYYFDVTLSSGIKLASDTGYTYIQYVGNGLDIPDLQSGSTVDAYQIISIPLDLANNQISAVLEDDLNEYNIKKWRFFNYRNSLLTEYQNGLSAIETGNGYWLISRNPANINTGEGTTVKVRSSNPYVIRLKKGWNQVGNPYNFNVSWKDVKAYNKLPEGLGNLRVFESEYKDSDILRRFRGAFVFVDQDMVLQIPVLKNNAANARLSAEQEDKFNLNSLWEVNFSLLSKEMNYRLGGAGMNAEANMSKDRYDDITVPRFVKYLEMNFRHEEYFAPKFTKDIRPVEPNQTWEFTVESNISSQAVTLNWKKFLSEKMDQSKKLVLYDITHDRAVDLLHKEQYVFHQDSLTQFKLFYGTQEYINEHLQAYQTILNGNYPNPFRESTIFAFRLSEAAKSYRVRLMVYDMQGRLVSTLRDGVLEAGTHEVSWDGTANTGRKLPADMYLYKLEAVSENGSYVFTDKLIIQ